jgi:hypothetical protein
VYADAQLSEDTARRANRPSPKGYRGVTAMRQHAASLASQASAAPVTACRPGRGNAGYAEAVGGLLT